MYTNEGIFVSQECKNKRHHSRGMAVVSSQVVQSNWGQIQGNKNYKKQNPRYRRMPNADGNINEGEDNRKIRVVFSCIERGTIFRKYYLDMVYV